MTSFGRVLKEEYDLFLFCFLIDLRDVIVISGYPYWRDWSQKGPDGTEGGEVRGTGGVGGKSVERWESEI